MTGRLFSKLAALSCLSLAMLLASCGGAGGGSSVADGGIRGTGASVGPVSGFGSVIVNGIRFVTENLGIDDFVGEAGVPTEEDLKKGMILQIRGEWQDDGQGEAESVRYDDTLRGPVTAVPEPWDGITKQGRIEVMGLTVTLDRLTQTTLVDLTTISTGQTLRISGWLQADGSFRASYVGESVTSVDTGEEIEGYLSVIGEESNQRYAVGDLEMVISEGAVCGELDLVDGALVAAEGRYEGELARFVVEKNGLCKGPADFLTASLDQDVQIAGVVTDGFTGGRNDGRFALNGIPVITSEDTDFDDLEPADISDGLLLQVEGRYINDNGALTLRAEEVEYRDADADVKGRLDEVNGDTVRVGGVEIRLTPFAIRDEDCPSPLGPEHVGGIELEVAGIQRTIDGGYLEALEIECESEADEREYELEGRIDEIIDIVDNRRRILILGTSLLVDGNTDFGDSGVSPDELAAGDRIEAEYSGPPMNGDYLVKELELESEEEADSDDD